MFGRRKRRDEAAAEAVREAERRALFAQLAERPEHICPFLGLAGERAGYVEGVSDDHRCYAFGDPAPLSAEQQTRVCQERGYGNCPRYLRGVLVIPTEELEALRRPRPAVADTARPPVPAPAKRRRRAVALLPLLILLVVLGGGAAGYLLWGRGLFPPVALESESPSPTPSLTAEPTPSDTVAPSATPEPTATPADGSGPATPTPEPTPSAGDTFAFYEVSVGPEGYRLFAINNAGEIVDTRDASFGGFSYARVDPRRGAEHPVFWETAEGGLVGWSYLYPNSGDFRIRAVFLNSEGERRSAYISEDELRDYPEATPAP